MRTIRLLFWGLCFWMGLGGMPALGASGLTVYMTEIPGQTMRDQNEAGAALDILRAVTKQAGYKLTEEFVPWTRALQNTENRPMSLSIPVARTESREEKFTWISELYQLKFGFVSTDKSVDDLAAARKLDLIGVWRGSYMQEFLLNNGFSNLVPVSSDVALARMLVRGRFEAWYGSLNEAIYNLRGIDEESKQKIRFGRPLSFVPVWIAGSADLPENVTRKLRHAYETIKRDESFSDIIERYGINQID